MASTFYVYMLRCRGGSLYTGITTDLERRLKEHKGKSGKGAKYTFSHEPFAFECVFETQTRQLASRLEYHIKTLSKNKKEELIKNPALLLKFLGDKIECEKYTPVNLKEDKAN